MRSNDSPSARGICLCVRAEKLAVARYGKGASIRVATRRRYTACDLVTRGRERPRFLYYTLVAAVARGAFADGQGSTIDHLTGDMLRAHRFPFPPTAEQHAIANFLDHETARIDAMIAKVNEAIDHLTEYRTALIPPQSPDKIDVRHRGDHMVSDNTPTTQARP